MKDKNSPTKIKKEKQIYWGGNDKQMQWKDIKHLQLEDDDIIHSGWVDDEDCDCNGYWHTEIIRMVEETDEEFEKRQHDIQLQAKWAKERRYESYLRLKKEFELE